jgi:gliding motility-associated-like protein
LTLSLGTGTTFTPQFILGQTSYYITENVNGCEGPPSQITVSIKDCEKLDIIIPTAFTPNGDEENDFWELIDISTIYPNHKVYIYNRWGSLLYESEFGAYQLKPWDGTTSGNPLPVGSYYYIIDALGDGSSYLKGVVSIILD